MNFIRTLQDHKAFLILTIFGGVVVTLWGPLSDVFLTGHLHPNINITIESEVAETDSDSQLVTFHVVLINRGSVPVTISKTNSLVLEIKKIENIIENVPVDPETLATVTKVDLLGNLIDEEGGSYTIEPGTRYDEMAVIKLASGIYWVNATLIYDNDDHETQSEVVTVNSSVIKGPLNKANK
jgi:hypothetical protein